MRVVLDWATMSPLEEAMERDLRAWEDQKRQNLEAAQTGDLSQVRPIPQKTSRMRQAEEARTRRVPEDIARRWADARAEAEKRLARIQWELFAELWFRRKPRLEFVGVDDVAGVFQVYSSTVETWAEEGALPKPSRLNGTTMFWHRQELDEFFDAIIEAEAEDVEDI